MARQWSTRRRSSSMIGVGSYCCLAVETPPLVEDHPLLPGTSLVLFRLRDRCDELRFAAVLDDLTGGLPVGVQLPVTAGVLVGGVEDGPFEEPVIHPARMYSFTKRVSPLRPPRIYPLPAAVKAT